MFTGDAEGENTQEEEAGYKALDVDKIEEELESYKQVA